MFSSLLNIVDSVFTLDEGCVRKDLIAGDSVTIEGNYNRDVSGRISGVGSLACIYDREQKDKKFFIIVGKHKIALTGDMDLTPKPQSLINQVRKAIRITTDDAKFLEIRFNDPRSLDNWLLLLGECLAEVMCVDAVNSFGTQNAPTVSTLQHCISTCELLASPTKECVQKIHKMYEIKQRLHDVMRTLRTNPCDVSVKDIRWLKESCKNVPEMATDQEMKFLLERLPQDRYTSYELQVILKDIIYADMDGLDAVVCAQAMTELSSTAGSDAADCTTLANAVLIEDSGSSLAASSDTTPQLSASTVSQPISSSTRSASSVSQGAVHSANGSVKVPVHKKSRIALNGVEIQSNFKSPSSAGKALARQIKIKSKFTTPAQRKEVKTPKSKSPKSKSPVNMGILADIRYNVSPLPAGVGSATSTCVDGASSGAGVGPNSYLSPVRQFESRTVASQDKENCKIDANIARSPVPEKNEVSKKYSPMKQVHDNSVADVIREQPCVAAAVHSAIEAPPLIETCTPFSFSAASTSLKASSAAAPITVPKIPAPASFVRSAVEVTEVPVPDTKVSAPTMSSEVVQEDVVVQEIGQIAASSPAPTAVSSSVSVVPATVTVSSSMVASIVETHKVSSPAKPRAPASSSMQVALAAFPDASAAEILHSSPYKPAAVTLPIPAPPLQLQPAPSVVHIPVALPNINFAIQNKICSTPVSAPSSSQQASVLTAPATENSRGKKSSADHAVRSPVRPLRAKPSSTAPVSTVAAAVASSTVPVESSYSAATTIASATVASIPVLVMNSQPAPALHQPGSAQLCADGAVPPLTPVKLLSPVIVSSTNTTMWSAPRWLQIVVSALLLVVLLACGASSMRSAPAPVIPIAVVPAVEKMVAPSLAPPVSNMHDIAVETPFIPIIQEPKMKQEPRVGGGFEMRMRYDGPSPHVGKEHRTGPQPHMIESKAARESTRTMAVRGGSKIGQEHHQYQDRYSVQSQSRVLQDKLRRLASFLALPMKAARSFLRTALVKFRQIKQVLLN